MSTLSLKPTPELQKRVKGIRREMKAKKSKQQEWAERKAVREARAAKVLETRKLLSTTFPAAFRGKGKRKAPLAIGIDKAVFAALPDYPKIKIRRAIRDYTSGVTYLRALIGGGARIAIDGSEQGEVTPDQIDAAKRQLDAVRRRKDAFRQRKAARKKGARRS